MFLHFSCFVLSAQLILARVGVLTCVSDGDCMSGDSCHKSICTKCLKCDLLSRKGNDCVVDFNHCGGCLKGYEEVLITDSSTAVKPCKPVRLKEKLKEQKCSNDEGCPPDNYCHQKSCVKCFNCSLVNRVSTPGNCTKLLSDCGSCINGFEEVAVTLGTDLKLCKRSTVTTVTKLSNMKVWQSSSFLYVCLGASCSSLLLLFAFIFIINRKRKARIIIQSKCPQLPSAPPLSILGSPQHIKKLEEEKFNVVYTEDCKQQAKVFKQPNASYYFKDWHGENETNSDHDSENLTQSFIPNFSAPVSAPSNDNIINSEEILGNISTEESNGISEAESPEQPSEVSMNSISGNEQDDQPTGISVEDTVDTELRSGKNHRD